MTPPLPLIPAGRLTEAHEGQTDALLQGYSHDDTGNRLSATVGGVTTPYGYPTGNTA